MTTTLGNIETLADDRRKSTSTSVISWTGNGFRAINGALQVWNQQHDFPWQIDTTLMYYNEGITWYPISDSLNFKAILDVRPYKTAEKNNTLYYITNSYFDGDYIHPFKMAVQTQGQAKYLRLKYTGNMTTINAATSLSDNGTWSGATAISSVATNTYEYFDQSASVGFNYSGTTGTLTNSTMTSQDLSRYSKRSNIYFNLFLQSVTNFTSVAIKVGSSDSAYITGTLTTDYLGNTPVAGWNKFKLEWNGSTTEVGTTDASAIDYVQVTITYGSSSTFSGNCLENIFVSENVPMNFEYYSNNMVMDISASNAKLQIFNDSGATGDLALWTDQWDFVNEAFINSVMEIISWLNGDTKEREVAIDRIKGYVEPLKSRLPSRRRYAEMGFTADLNLGSGGSPRAYPYRRYSN